MAALRGRGLLERSGITSVLLPVLEEVAIAGAPRCSWLVAPIVQAALGVPEAIARALELELRVFTTDRPTRAMALRQARLVGGSGRR